MNDATQEVERLKTLHDRMLKDLDQQIEKLREECKKGDFRNDGHEARVHSELSSLLLGRDFIRTYR